MSGVDNMNYMYSLNATANGEMTADRQFRRQDGSEHRSDSGADRARRRPPRSFPRMSPTMASRCRKSVTAPLMLIALYSPQRHLRRAVPGQLRLHQSQRSSSRACRASAAFRYSAPASTRCACGSSPINWRSCGITVPEIVSAIQAQNTVNPAGQVGGEPAPKGQEFTYSVRAQGRLHVAGRIRADRRSRNAGRRDRARAGRGARRTWARRTTASPAASMESRAPIIAVYQLPGSNAVAGRRRASRS